MGLGHIPPPWPAGLGCPGFLRDCGPVGLTPCPAAPGPSVLTPRDRRCSDVPCPSPAPDPSPALSLAAGEHWPGSRSLWGFPWKDRHVNTVNKYYSVLSEVDWSATFQLDGCIFLEKVGLPKRARTRTSTLLDLYSNPVFLDCLPLFVTQPCTRTQIQNPWTQFSLALQARPRQILKKFKASYWGTGLDSLTATKKDLFIINHLPSTAPSLW